MKTKATISLLFALLCLSNLTAQSNYTGYPSDVIDYFDDWKITLGSGSTVKELVDYENADYFFNTNDGEDWVVYKTPNSGGTTPNSSNTRSELRQYNDWTPEIGGKLTGKLKVMHVSTTGNAMVPATFSVVIGQIHSDEGHKNEPLKIFYKKFPGHTKGSVFWNYEINTEGDNSERWDYSTAVWGYDWSVVGNDSISYPEEPVEGIALGEEFSYEVNVYQGIMYLTFKCEGLASKTFTKNLTTSEYTSYEEVPAQVLSIFASTGQDGTEQTTAYAGELLYFKQGAYNQTNGKSPSDNMIWNTGAQTYGGDLAQQYANGSYAEVWFKNASVGEATEPDTSSTALKDNVQTDLHIYPNPATSSITIASKNTIISYQIYTLTGQCLLTDSKTNSPIDISHLSAGNYLLVSEDVSHQKSFHPLIKQ